MSNDNQETQSQTPKLCISLSLTNPPHRIPIEISSPSPSCHLHQLASTTTTIPLPSVRLIFRGKMIPSWEEGNVVDDFKLESGCVIHCLGKPQLTLLSSANNSNSNSAAVGSSGSVVTPPMSTSAASAATTPSSNTATAATASNNNNNQDPLSIELSKMKTNHTNSEYTTALNTISKLLSNIITHPMEEKYRKVKRSNAAFTKQLGQLSNSHEILHIW